MTVSTISDFESAHNDSVMLRKSLVSVLLHSACVFGLSIGFSSGAYAQEAEKSEENSADNAEIIVTANKREQSLRDVSISISAVKPGDLEKLGGDKFNEFLQGVAGVSIQDLGGQAQNVVFRGITSAPDGDSAVAVYFDELPLGGANFGVQIKPIDIERFEVLRGPQPILYGAGSLTGTLRLIPKRPDLNDTEFGGDIGLSHVESSNGASYDVSGYVNVPVVSDKIAIRVAGFAERDKGYVDNIRLNRKVGTFQSEGGRASIAFAPSETINLLAQYVYQANSYDGSSAYRPILSRANPSLGRFQIDRAAEKSSVNFHLAGLTADVELGGVKITSVTSYRRSKGADSVDRLFVASAFEPVIGGLLPEVSGIQSIKNSVFSQELRLTNAGQATFSWAAGAFYQTGNTTIITARTSPSLSDFIPDIGTAIQSDISVSKNRDISVFAQIGYDFTPEFDVSAGARYTWFSRRDDFSSTFLGEFNDPDRINGKSNSFNPQLTLTYKPDSRHTYYARVAKGYRAPNSSSSSTPSCVVPPLKPDQVISYELGTKVSLAGGAVNINAAGYYTDWQNIPVFTTPPGCGPNDSFQVNAGKGRSYGLEAELFAKISNSVTLNSSLTLSKSQLGKVPFGFVGGVNGEQLPGNANLRMSGGLTYTKPISDNATIFTSINAIYVGPYKNFLSGDFDELYKFAFSGPDGTPPLIDGANPDFLRDPGAGDYALMNLRAGLNFDNWSASVYVNNVLNSRATSLVGYPLDQLTPGEAPFVSVKPRTIGIDLSFNF